MRLRDQFATAAMQAMLSRASIAELETTDGYSADECSQDAYIYADAMLHERKKKHLRAREFRTLSAAIASGRKRPRCGHGVPEGDWCEPCNKEYKRAAIIGVVTITRIWKFDGSEELTDKERAFGDFTPGRFGFEGENPIKIEPIPCKGALNFFPLDPELEKLVKERMG